MIDRGLGRQEAYQRIQKLSQSLKDGKSLKEILLMSGETRDYFTSKELDEIFSAKRHRDQIKKIIKKALEV